MWPVGKEKMKTDGHNPDQKYNDGTYLEQLSRVCKRLQGEACKGYA